MKFAWSLNDGYATACIIMDFFFFVLFHPKSIKFLAIQDYVLTCELKF